MQSASPKFLLVLSEAKPMDEQRGTGPELSADPAAEQGAATPPKKDRQEGVVSNAYAAGAGDLFNGRFQLIECVGAGGMSTVYRALDRHDAPDRYIAVKVLNPRFQTDPQRLAALQREVECCQQLVHPNIVRVYEFHRDGSSAYLTMEYLRGEPLTARIRSESFTAMSAPEALPIISAMGQALAYAHSRGIVHCDFKPANVFLTEAGEIKLIDFGIARAFAAREEEATVGDGRLLSFEAISPAYASPEILEGRDPDPRDDVYSLACTAYELLTGVHPFAYQPAIEAREAGLTVERRRGLSYRQWEALRGALAFERGKRTPTVARFINDFNEGRLVWRAKPSYLAAGAAACLLVAVFGLIGLRSSGPQREVIEPTGESAAAGLNAALTDLASKPPVGQKTAAALADQQPLPRMAQSVTDEARRPPEIAPDHGDPAPSGRLPEQISDTVPSGASKRGAKVTVSNAHTLRVLALLAQAERQIAAKQLTTPAGDAAFESYEQVLKLIPGHEGALEGIARIKGEYKLWAEADKRGGNWKRAEANLEKALAIDSEDPNLRGALDALREAQKRAEKEAARKVREQEPHRLARQETGEPKAKRRTQVKVRALTTLNHAGGEIIITEQECPNDPRGNFAVSTAVNQTIIYTGCAVRFDQDRFAIQWNNGTVSAHSMTEFVPSEAVFEQGLRALPSHEGSRSSRDDVRSEDPMACPVTRFEEFEWIR